MRTTSTTCSATSARSAVNGSGRVFNRAVVVIPAHNEADNLASSVKAVLAAAACLPLPVAVIVMLDGSAALAGQFGSDVHFVAIDERNVGAARRYLAAYRSKSRPDGHGHVHGANMGFRAGSYWRVGGFAALASGEDVDLVARFESAGLRIVRDAQLRSLLASVRAEPA
jgi:hypothetical protein